MGYRWTDVPLTINITVERIKVSDLPTWIGRSPSLDQSIARVFEDGTKNYIWIYNHIYHKELIILNKEFSQILGTVDSDKIEIEIEVKSTGYLYPGDLLGCPSVSKEERVIITINLVPYDNNADVSIEEKDFYLFEDQFTDEIDGVDLPDSVYEHEYND